MGLLYTKAKIFHFKEKLDSLPASEPTITAPVHIRIKPTNFCNHRCWFCAYGEDNLTDFGKTNVPRVSIPPDKMMEITDDVIEMGVKAVTFSGGGDPFVYKHILPTVKRLANSPVKFASLTNGALLKGELAEIFSSHGTWVRVSMDGFDNASYTKLRSVKDGEYDLIMENMKQFKRLGGKCYLSVVLIILEENAQHIYEQLRRLRDTGVDSVKPSPCLANDTAEATNAYHQRIFEVVKSQIAQAKADLLKPGFEIYDAYNHLDGKYAKDYNWCPNMQIVPIIGADMNVYTCPDKAYNLEHGLIGSISRMRFKDFWFSEKNKFFKVNPALHCCHHCEANSKNKLILEYLEADKEHLDFV